MKKSRSAGNNPPPPEITGLDEDAINSNEFVFVDCTRVCQDGMGICFGFAMSAGTYDGPNIGAFKTGDSVYIVLLPEFGLKEMFRANEVASTWDKFSERPRGFVVGDVEERATTRPIIAGQVSKLAQCLPQ